MRRVRELDGGRESLERVRVDVDVALVLDVVVAGVHRLVDDGDDRLLVVRVVDRVGRHRQLLRAGETAELDLAVIARPVGHDLALPEQEVHARARASVLDARGVDVGGAEDVAQVGGLRTGRDRVEDPVGVVDELLDVRLVGRAGPRTGVDQKRVAEFEPGPDVPDRIGPTPVALDVRQRIGIARRSACPSPPSGHGLALRQPVPGPAYRAVSEPSRPGPPLRIACAHQTACCPAGSAAHWAAVSPCIARVRTAFWSSAESSSQARRIIRWMPARWAAESGVAGSKTRSMTSPTAATRRRWRTRRRVRRRRASAAPHGSPPSAAML